MKSYVILTRDLKEILTFNEVQSLQVNLNKNDKGLSEAIIKIEQDTIFISNPNKEISINIHSLEVTQKTYNHG